VKEMLGWWNNGTMEQWNNGIMELSLPAEFD
jgi:hypothetical protein